jgi:hypothetical protein
VAYLEPIPERLVSLLRGLFFAADRDIAMDTGRTITLADGTVIDTALDAQFVTLAATGSLANERVLTAGTGISIVDGGAGSTVTINATGATIPSGLVAFWPSTAGAVPSGWSTFAAGNGKFLVGADGGTFTDGGTGGAETVDIQHSHTSGTLGTDSDSHSHTSGTLATDSDNHSHTDGTLVTVGPSAETALDANLDATTKLAPVQGHTHNISGSTASDSHSHSVTSGSTASDAHTHLVTTGSTATALSTTQSILPPWLGGTWISKD